MVDPQELRRDAAGRLLGLPVNQAATAPVSLQKVEHWGRQGWVFELAGTALTACRFFIESAATGTGGYCRTDQLVFGYEQEEVPELLMALLHRFRKRLDGRSWDQVRQWLDDRFGIRRAMTQEEADAETASQSVPVELWQPPGATGPVESIVMTGYEAGFNPLGGPRPATAAAQPQAKACPGVHISWNHPLAWHRFFADEEFLPFRDGVIHYPGPMVRAEHGDLECQFLPPRGFICPPWNAIDVHVHRTMGWARADRIRRRNPEGPRSTTPVHDHPGIRPGQRFIVYREGVAGAPVRRFPAIPWRWIPWTPPTLDKGIRHDHQYDFFTNLVDVNVIDGATNLLEDLLDGIRETIRPDTLFVNCTCVPQIIGDDVDYVIRTERERAPYPLLFKDQRPKDPWEKNIAMMRQAFAEAPPVPRDALAVNLVGFMEGRDRDELEALLRGFGIRVNRFVIPVLHPSVAPGYLAASLQVFAPSQEWERLYREVFGELDIASLKVAAPYGIAATTEFLTAVAQALGRADLVPGIEAGEREFRMREFEPLAARATSHRIGLVCEQRRLHRLAGFGSHWGLPLVKILKEIGFRISLALVAEPGHPEKTEAARAWWAGEGLDTTIVEKPADLDAWLADPSIEAVYSDFFYDDRLVRTGHAPFSLQVFSRGWAGAARTARRIIERCEAGFFLDCRTTGSGGD